MYRQPPQTRSTSELIWPSHFPPPLDLLRFRDCRFGTGKAAYPLLLTTGLWQRLGSHHSSQSRFGRNLHAECPKPSPGVVAVDIKFRFARPRHRVNGLAMAVREKRIRV